ncbi:heparinase II/III family protein [Aeromonas dhakensis]|uniref:heparinase II/III domain-containing protein n=1 Tax=Aeromonas dhakensis TaxID=196024 RepID=UPI0032955A3D
MMVKLIKAISWSIDLLLASLGFDIYKFGKVKFRFINFSKNEFDIKKISIPKEISDAFEIHIYTKESDVIGACFRDYSLSEMSNYKRFLAIGIPNIVRYFKKREHIDSNYVFIDWYTDKISKKSIPLIRHRLIREHFYLDKLEIKSIWDNARFHELVSIAILIKSSGSNKGKLISEFRSRFYDFTLNNPVGFGPNWVCAMEVGIRAINLIIAGAMLSTKLPSFLIKDIECFIEESRSFIEYNLENKGGKVNNHYLTNVVSLLFILKYSEQQVKYSQLQDEFVKQILYQFNDDGSNFESSTSYHCLSFELFKIGYYCLSDDRKEKLTDKLYGAASFLNDIYYNLDGKHRIGDDDSGKILKTIFDYKMKDDALIFGIESLVGDKNWIDSVIIESFSKGKYLNEDYFDNSLFKTEKFNFDLLDRAVIPKGLTFLKKPQSSSYRFRTNGINIDALKVCHYNKFGCYIIKGYGFSLLFRVGGQNSGHRHEDELHLDIYNENGETILDSGSVNYTYLPNIRNIYRSAVAHFVPYESNLKKEMLFSFSCKEHVSHTLQSFNNGYLLVGEYGEYRREIYLFADEILVVDLCCGAPVNISGKSVFLNSSAFYGSFTNEKIINYLSSL